MRASSVLLALLLATGCGDDGGGPRATVSSPVLEPAAEAPLAATLRFETSEPVVPTVEVIGPERSFTVPASGLVGGAAARTEHEVRILGLAPERTYLFRIGGRRVVADESLAYTTPPLPRGFPRLEVSVLEPGRTRDGVTLLGMTSLLSGGWVVALDGDATPVWYRRADGALSGVLRRSNGNVVAASTSWKRFDELDALGRLVRRVRPEDVGSDSLHHGTHEGADGHLIALGSERVMVDGPGGAPMDIVADVIYELDDAGAVLRSWRILDVLEPERILADAAIPFWGGFYEDGPTPLDWSHVNSVVYRPERDSLVVSSLNQRIVFEMRCDSGELVWVLGEDSPSTTADDDWPWLTLEGGGKLPYRQHGVALDPDGQVLVYDNAFDTQDSRAAAFVVDPERRTARQSFEWNDSEVPVFSPIGGSHVALPGGNALVNDTLVLSRGLTGRVTQVARATGAKQLELFLPGAPAFNAQWLPSLYP